MSDNAFAKAMNHIAVEAENQRIEEERQCRRQRLLGRICSAGGFLLGAALLGAGYHYRAPLQDYVSAKFASAPQMSAGTGEALKGIQAEASKRDQVLDQLGGR
jgi:hypothetical protein